MWNCPKCNEASEDNFDSCWKCGAGRGGEPVAAGMERESPAPTHAPPKTNWPAFFGMLLSPSLLSTLLFSFKSPTIGMFGLCVALAGSVVAGVGCAGALARHFSQPGETKLSLAIVFFCLFTPLSLVLSIVGSCSLAPRW